MLFRAIFIGDLKKDGLAGVWLGGIAFLHWDGGG
jgi:hypothetical protein